MKKVNSLFVRLGMAVVLVAATWGGFQLGQSGFRNVEQFRQLERVPESKIAGIIEGVVHLNAIAVASEGTIPSRHTSTPSIYFRYVHEVEREDSDGDKYWDTVEDVERWVDFTLRDETADVPVDVVEGLEPIRWSVAQSFQERQGDHRYTEYRIEPGDPLFVFASVVDRNGLGYRVRFNEPGPYTPIVSTGSAEEERESMGVVALVKLWGGVVVLSFAVFAAMNVFHQHRVIVYLVFLTIVLAGALGDMGYRMMSRDIRGGAQRLTLQEIRSEEAAREILGESWGGWSALGPVAELSVGDQSRTRLRHLRRNLALARESLRRQMDAFPEKLLVPLWGLDRPPVMDGLPPAEEAWVGTALASFEPTRVDSPLLPLFLALGGLAALLGTWRGFRSIRFKRFIESTPTVTTDGVAIGISELVGYVKLPEGGRPLNSPLTNTKCVWYFYKVEERRGSGKKRRWVTIEKRTEDILFLCRDEAGVLPINPDGSEVITHRKKRKRRGNRRYTERALAVGDNLYALGLAGIDESGEGLILREGDSDDPFLLSNYPESAVMFYKARQGMLLLNLAFAGVLLGGLLLFAQAGSFAATDFLAAAMLAPAYMFPVVIALHYNDLVWLRRRVERNRANIDVSLQKRHDLLDALEKVVKAYMGHEKELLERVAGLRQLHGMAKNSDRDLEAYLQAERGMHDRLIARREAYPELKANELMGDLMERMTKLEDELALMREGYNDAVEIYNARIESFPDSLLARRFGFRGERLIEAPESAREVPAVT